jgi:hypothetical protein
LALDTGREEMVAILVKHQCRFFARICRHVCNGNGKGMLRAAADRERRSPVDHDWIVHSLAGIVVPFATKLKGTCALIVVSICACPIPTNATHVVRSSAACFVIVIFVSPVAKLCGGAFSFSLKSSHMPLSSKAGMDRKKPQ